MQKLSISTKAKLPVERVVFLHPRKALPWGTLIALSSQMQDILTAASRSYRAFTVTQVAAFDSGIEIRVVLHTLPHQNETYAEGLLLDTIKGFAFKKGLRIG